MSQSQGLTLSEFQSFFHRRGQDFANALGGFLQAMSGGFDNTAEGHRPLSEFMQQRLEKISALFKLFDARSVTGPADDLYSRKHCAAVASVPLLVSVGIGHR